MTRLAWLLLAASCVGPSLLPAQTPDSVHHFPVARTVMTDSSVEYRHAVVLETPPWACPADWSCAPLPVPPVDTTPIPPQTDTVTPPLPPPPPPSAKFGIGVGPFNATPGVLGTVFLTANSPANLKAQLVAAKAGGYRIFAIPTGGKHSNYFTGGKYDTRLWRAVIEKYRADSALWRQYSEAGTLAGVSIKDEPQAGALWGGLPIPWGIIEQEACVARAIFATTIYTRTDATALPASHNCLGGGMLQYSVSRGPIATYAAAQLAAAKAKGYMLLVGVNYENGGKIVSGCQQSLTRPGNCRMSGAELTSYLKALAADSTRVCAITLWGPDTSHWVSYTGASDVKAAVTSLIAWAKTRPRPAKCGG